MSSCPRSIFIFHLLPSFGLFPLDFICISSCSYVGSHDFDGFCICISLQPDKTPCLTSLSKYSCASRLKALDPREAGCRRNRKLGTADLYLSFMEATEHQGPITSSLISPIAMVSDLIGSNPDPNLQPADRPSHVVRFQVSFDLHRLSTRHIEGTYQVLSSRLKILDSNSRCTVLKRSRSSSPHSTGSPKKM
ncbi:hypothetical protein BKA70DRAFT_1286211, partial [Coprinopsis sp. MPI-PUGE-AT-0042]